MAPRWKSKSNHLTEDELDMIVDALYARYIQRLSRSTESISCSFCHNKIQKFDCIANNGKCTSYDEEVGCGYQLMDVERYQNECKEVIKTTVSVLQHRDAKKLLNKVVFVE